MPFYVTGLFRVRLMKFTISCSNVHYSLLSSRLATRLVQHLAVVEKRSESAVQEKLEDEEFDCRTIGNRE